MSELLTLQHRRVLVNAYGTFGALELDGALICYLLELNWRNNAKGDWKTGSCVPVGNYLCTQHTWSANPEQPTWLINNVPGRDGCLYHPGNSIHDLHGCCCPGLVKVETGVEQSRAAIKKIAEVIGGFDQSFYTNIFYDSTFVNRLTA